MQQIKNPIGGSNQFGTIDIVPDKVVDNMPIGIFLCGLGTVGNGSSTALDLLNNDITQGIKDSADKYGIIWICPQTGAVYNLGEIDFALTIAAKRYNTSKTQIYLGGLSLGGGATFGYAMQSLANAQKFAAIFPMATTWPVGDPRNIANAGIGVWASHNINDTNGGTPYAATVNTINAINAANPKVKAAYTGFNATGHGSWGEFTNATTIPIPPASQGLINPGYNLYQWLLANSIGNPVAAGNPLPTAFTPQPLPVDSIIHSYQVDEYQSGKCIATKLK